ncbi:NAD(P)-dependent dehydrogenase, short-chain alcohol dehydrogenase family [Parasphingorhabdus marina DSM 22363]|uniref:NAD(P)-dependent dehydrogenase, short-chain alcohol dehydrogenase family n=1 Tax=Parasphingorhabdus marina DSM 22363 TaxID=1123272 RepID=A0A1N6EI03_9SPHN|nr:SDR family NAD(P)-dependent oxidoreductase [Parasphingorhabdus marina]SIN82626.1 NAD(P)-dependent dehydrogenase, short-chain alcohol dehydrogenase family [Parasphingorhabdus marina DSM 22363]
MFDLSGHVALVTGGNGGLGLAMAKGLAKAGASIAIWGRDDAKNASACTELREMGADAEAFVCDVTNAEACQSAFAATTKNFGHVDSCFANAGGSGPMGMLHQLDQHAWKSVLDLNLNSVVNTFQPAIGHMLEQQKGGKLIVMSSAAALVGTPLSAGYATTKAAVVGLIRSLALELGQAGIQANAILPGYIETEMSARTPQTFKDACKRRSASGQHGTLEDMEGVAVFLASPESRFMTGQCLVLDGGHSIHPM